MHEQSEQTPEAGEEWGEVGRLQRVVVGFLVGLLCFIGVCVWSWTFTVPLANARDLAGGRLDEVRGTLVECERRLGSSRSGGLLSGFRYCLSDPERPLEVASITVGWPDYNELGPAIGEPAVGLVDGDRELVAFRLAGGEVVSGNDVGWRSVWEMFFAGLAAFWSALKLWRLVFREPGVGRGRIADRLAWSLGLGGLVVLGAHARMPIVALPLDVLFAVGLVVVRVREGRQGLRDFLADAGRDPSGR